MTYRFALPLLCLVLFACSRQHNNISNKSRLQTGDPTYDFRWPRAKEENMERKAQDGDVQSARDLYDHYVLVGNDGAAGRLENQLIADGYLPAMTRKAGTLLREAQSLSDRDPNKRKALLEALNLASRAATTPKPKNIQVYVNGKPILVPNLEVEDLRNSIQKELWRTSDHK